MSKKNNDALEQEKEDAQVIENDDETIDNDDSVSAGNATDNDASASADDTTDNDASASADKTTDNDASKDEDKPSGSPKILIAEILIAVAAIGFIIFALISNNKGQGSVSDNTTASDNIVASGNTVPNTEGTTFDNSILYENIPAIPNMAELNHMTEDEAKAAVEDNTMLVFTTADGASLYVRNYTNQEYFISETSVSETDIDDFISENILSKFGETTEADHTVVSKNDVISANYVGKLDGVAFDGGTADNVQITVGAGGYIPGFEDGFIGMEVGETKDVPITFPENYGNAELAGKDVIFTFTVNEIISTITYPEELTDEMVQTIFYDGSYTTAAECRNLVKDIITENNVWSFVTENYYITSIPEDTINHYYNAEMASQEQNAAQYGMSVETLLSYYGMTIDDLKQKAITDACYTAILSSICNTLATENGISVSDEDIAAFAVEYGYSDTATLLSIIDEETVKDYLIQDKTLNYLVSLLP